MTALVWVLNGPNLGELGRREPDIYGSSTHDDLVSTCTETARELCLVVEVKQTDDEATYIAWLHEAARAGVDALILNPAAWTHTSVALRDAASMLSAPYVEVHLTNPIARESFRHVSFTAGSALGIVAGFGIDSYRLALRGLAAQLSR